MAVKVIRPNVLVGMGDAEIENFKSEAYIMSRLRHPNVVLIMGISMRNVGAYAGEYRKRSAVSEARAVIN